MSKKSRVKVRLLFVDEGGYREEDVEIPAGSIAAYDRLIDCVREDEAVQKVLYVDVDRLCSARIVED